MIPLTEKQTAGIQNRFQTRANGNEIEQVIRLSKNTAIIESPAYTETAVLPFEGVRQTSIAVEHSKRLSRDVGIYIAYVTETNDIRVVYSRNQFNMSSYAWRDTGFRRTGEFVDIAFDGTMEPTLPKRTDFITAARPTVFYITDGELHAVDLGSSNDEILAESGCTYASAVRGTWANDGGIDYGLIVFFVANGMVFYRQRIRGEWDDAVVVPMPDRSNYIDKEFDYYITQISATRTNDYRILLQILDRSGYMWTLVTKPMLLSQDMSEHIVPKSIRATAELIEIEKISTSSDDHLVPKAITANAMLYSAATPQIIKVRNIQNGNDYGKLLRIDFNVEMNPATFSELSSQFYLADSNGTVFIPYDTPYQVSGKYIILDFSNFNNASGTCTLRYYGTTVESMAAVIFPVSESVFVPVNLVPSTVPVPEVVEIYNV